ncbi:MAG: mechanosensitive ion channel domain-containing protein [Bacillota bacterium]
MSITATLLFYFILLLLTRWLFKNLLDKEYQIIKDKLKFPVLLILLNAALLIPFQSYDDINLIMENLQHLFVITFILIISWLIIRLLNIFIIYLSNKNRIDVKDNLKARTEEINLTYVIVKVWDQRRLVVPTTYFIDNIFQNWTRKTSEILGTVFYILIIQYP